MDKSQAEEKSRRVQFFDERSEQARQPVAFRRGPKDGSTPLQVLHPQVPGELGGLIAIGKTNPFPIYERGGTATVSPLFLYPINYPIK